jgi:hypothetical protein
MSVFVFFHVGSDTSQPTRLVQSIIKIDPASDIIMCSDSSTPRIDGVTTRLNTAGDRSRLMEFRLAAFASARLDCPAIYLDTDMVVQEPISPSVLIGNNDVMMCRRSFNKSALFNTSFKGLDFPEYAGKTLDEVYPYLACATITRDYKPWAVMSEILYELDQKFSIWYGDQEALKLYALNARVGLLNESDYACLPEMLTASCAPKIIHFKGRRKYIA